MNKLNVFVETSYSLLYIYIAYVCVCMVDDLNSMVTMFAGIKMTKTKFHCLKSKWEMGFRKFYKT